MPPSELPASPSPASGPDQVPGAEWSHALWAMSAAFGCYFCMYAFRKPFTAATYAETFVSGIPFKTVLVTTQVGGYMLSKFLGIRVIAEMPPERRAIGILWLIAVAEAALVLFGLVPRPWNAACLLMNGLPLGMVFGLVLGCLEGRRLTEALAAGLCASFILADGVTKSVGVWLLARGVPEDWMPSVAGGVFLVPLAISVAMLAQVPPPNARDTAARSSRPPMTRSDRIALLTQFPVSLLLMVGTYLLVTVLRSIRSDFAPELWRGLGHAAPPEVYTATELIIALACVVVNGSVVLIRDNRVAFLAALATCGLGLAILGLALLGLQQERLDGFTFMVLLGLGLYFPYIAFHTTIFERLLAMTRGRGNIGFLMYLADSIGYLGYIAVMIAKEFWHVQGDILRLLIAASWATIALATVGLVLVARFSGRMIPAAAGQEPPPEPSWSH